MKWIKLLLWSVVLVALDQLSKWWTVSTISLGEIKPFIPGFVSLTYLQNKGATFSILQDQQWFFTVITIAVLSFAVYYYITNKQMHFWKELALFLIISGAIGNFSDRLTLGYVVDMVHLDVIDFAIFNVADSYLCVGVFLLMVILWKED
ncbi:signal peptidase II [Streptococcus iniae]|uniref:signal peptidase II n=1 Tax=Streptococcus iniae TaxID=1346 RepID=UPI002B2E7E24|nr:signal peptidase II [Streptococcus iniae]WNZ89236.1 signal peptidase II [Streptococcus iniae]